MPTRGAVPRRASGEPFVNAKGMELGGVVNKNNQGLKWG